MTRTKALKIEENIYKILKENNIYPRYIGQFNDLPVFMVTIEGDWKHDHGYARHLLEECGYTYIKEESLPSWDDYYTATHYYLATDNERSMIVG